ncbi:MAG: SelB C-terminal domain-containing protein, partial [Actinobacteria bacterium]|nr:SelB C-terminal domain-containing protein [Actinomycetota bacterium]
RHIIRQLIQTGVLFEHAGIAFHRDPLESLPPALTQLWQTSPHGFTVSQLREAVAITRKHAIPLVACLDKIGFTRRTGDTRTAGSRW